MYLLRKLLFLLVVLTNIISNPSAQWVQSNGIYGGDFVTSAVLDSTLYIYIHNTGIYKTTDKGQTWTRLDSVWSIQNNIHLLSSSGDKLFAVSSHDIYMLSSESENWVKITQTQHSFFSCIDMATFGNDFLFAPDSGLVRLYNKDGRWHDTIIKQSNNYYHLIETTTKNIFFTDGCSVLRSKNNGISWDTCGLQSYCTAMSMINDSIGFIGTENGLYTTNNSGDSWYPIIDIKTGEKFQNILRIEHRNDTVLMSTSTKLWISINKGTTWNDINCAPFVYADSIDMRYKSNSNYPYIIHYIGNDFILGTSEGLFMYSFSRSDWKDISKGINSGTISCITRAGETLFAGGFAFGQLYRSEDNGSNWTKSDSGLDPLSWITSLVSSGSTVYTLTDGYLFQSIDNGITWQKSNLTNESIWDICKAKNGLFFGMIPYGINFLPNNENALIDRSVGLPVLKDVPFADVVSIATSDSLVFAAVRDQGVYVSTNSGVTWVAANNGLTDRTVRKLICHKGKLFVKTRDYKVFRADINNLVWQDITTNMPLPFVFCFAENGKAIFAGVNDSIIYSIDTGVSWKMLGNELPGVNVVISLLVDGNNLLAGTDNLGIWRYPLGDLLNVDNKAMNTVSNENKTILIQKKSGTISCSIRLPKQMNVFVRIFNVQGKMQPSSGSYYLNPGINVLKWNSNNFMPGCYLIQITAGTNLYSGKFMITK